MSKYAVIAALALLASPAAGSVGDGPPPDLELASVAVTDRIVGGGAGRSPQVLLAAAYDRVERGFRVVRRRHGPEGEEAWIGELEPAQFRALLELAVASGLPELPLESPPSCTDVYDEGRQIRLDYRGVLWANGAPEGCVHESSAVVPSAEQRERFDRVIARLERAVDDLPLRRGPTVALRRIPFVPDVRALAAYRRVMEHVLADPVRHRLDLERSWIGEGRVGFCWRGREAGPPGWDVEFVVDSAGAMYQRAPASATAEVFVAVETGMTLAEVAAALGEPDEEEQRADGGVIWTYSEDRAVAPQRLSDVLPARLRFEAGRLRAP